MDAVLKGWLAGWTAVLLLAAVAAALWDADPVYLLAVIAIGMLGAAYFAEGRRSGSERR